MATDFYDGVWAQIERRNPALQKAARIRIHPDELKRIAKMCYDAGCKHTREQLNTAYDMPDFMKGLFK